LVQSGDDSTPTPQRFAAFLHNSMSYQRVFS
jgi:hypothetical protein